MTRLIALFTLVFISSFVVAADALPTTLPTTTPIPALPDQQEMLVLEVNLAPGQESQPHRHNAHVFVYVLEGQVNMQVAGGEMVTLSAGETFYEDPDSIHLVSQNASDTAPAKLLVHLLKTSGEPVSVPVEQ